LAETFAFNLNQKAEQDRPEFLALVGLDMARAGRKDAADEVAAKAIELYMPDRAERPPVAPSLVALLIVLNQEPKLHEVFQVKLPPRDDLNLNLPLRLGLARGWAYQENWGQSMGLANAAGIPAQERWSALMAVAEVAVDSNPAEARKCLEPALDIWETDPATKTQDPWIVLRLVRLGARAGLGQRVQPVAEGMTDPGLKDRAVLELMRARLAALSQPDPEALTTEIQAEAPRPLVLELIARHNARYGNSASVTEAVATWEKEALRPFGYVGVALGLRDSGK
jgi:hypothetical protein